MIVTRTIWFAVVVVVIVAVFIIIIIFFWGGGVGVEGVINVACYTSTVGKVNKILRYTARICTITFKKILS